MCTTQVQVLNNNGLYYQRQDTASRSVPRQEDRVVAPSRRKRAPWVINGLRLRSQSLSNPAVCRTLTVASRQSASRALPEVCNVDLVRRGSLWLC